MSELRVIIFGVKFAVLSSEKIKTFIWQKNSMIQTFKLKYLVQKN